MNDSDLYRFSVQKNIFKNSKIFFHCLKNISLSYLRKMYACMSRYTNNLPNTLFLPQKYNTLRLTVDI